MKRKKIVRMIPKKRRIRMAKKEIKENKEEVKIETPKEENTNIVRKNSGSLNLEEK